MTASWRASLMTAAADPNRRVDELCTLRIRPDGIILDVTFLLSNVADWPSTIDVAVDDGWVPLSVPVTPPAGDLDRLPDGRHVFRFRPTPASHNDRKFTLRFRAHDSIDVGSHSLAERGVIVPKGGESLVRGLVGSGVRLPAIYPSRCRREPASGFRQRNGRERSARTADSSRRGQSRRELVPSRATSCGAFDLPGPTVARSRQRPISCRLSRGCYTTGCRLFWMVAFRAHCVDGPEPHRNDRW